MKKYNRIFVIVLDSLGIGAMPESEKFGDVGVDTFGHILDQMGTLEIPNLKKPVWQRLEKESGSCIRDPQHCIREADNFLPQELP